MMNKKADGALINAKIELKMVRKHLARQIAEMVKKEKKQKADLVKLMKEGGDPAIIDMKTESLSKVYGNLRKLHMNEARLEQFAEKIDEAHTQQRIGANMVQVTKALSRVNASMHLEKLETVMMDLGKQYEDIDVMSSVLDTTTAETTASATSPEEIAVLQRKLADEAGLELSKDLHTAGAVQTGPVRSEPTDVELAGSSERLKALRIAAGAV